MNIVNEGAPCVSPPLNTPQGYSLGFRTEETV